MPRPISPITSPIGSFGVDGLGVEADPGSTQFQAGGYRIDVLTQGYPGKATCHGGLGWSSVVLLRGHGRTALIDTGAFGMRKPLIAALEKLEVSPDDVTDVLLSHAHHDHMVNFPLFGRARMAIGAVELDWASQVRWGATPVPEVYVKELCNWPSLHRIEAGETVLPAVVAHLAPGHTPGHLVFAVTGETHDVIVVQDAAKNRAEIVTRCVDMTLDAAQSAASIARIVELWERRPGSILIPGHDLPMVLDGGRPKLLGARRAGISALFGETLEDATLFDLTGA